MVKRGFSLYDIEQFMKEAGAQQVTEDAVLELEKELERLTEHLAHRTLRYAKHAGRSKLIKKSDIMLTKHGLV